MDSKRTQILFEILRCAISGNPLSDAVKAELSPECLGTLYRLSAHHDLAHLVGVVLEQNGALPKTVDISKNFRQQYIIAVTRYEKNNHVLCEVCEALKQEQIPFIPLKGSVIRQYYPEPWMRTSCDIDILVHEADLEKAIGCLKDGLQYENKGRGSHDVSLFAPNGVNVELHYSLIEEVRYPIAVQILSNAWDYAKPTADDPYRHELSDDFFYFYHIAHMAKHFENGGCGIRPLLDLWFLEHRVPHDDAARNELLQKGGLLTFANAARTLSEVWFSGKETDDISLKMQEYVLYGGVYGTVDNGVAVRQTKQGGMLKSIRSRLFLPYEMLSEKHPILKKHRWLTPVYQVRRWFKVLFNGRAKRSLHELELNQNISKDRVDRVAQLLDEIGL